jgi:hypothetical protein
MPIHVIHLVNLGLFLFTMAASVFAALTDGSPLVSVLVKKSLDWCYSVVSAGWGLTMRSHLDGY